jgi:hypothetical protein
MAIPDLVNAPIKTKLLSRVVPILSLVSIGVLVVASWSLYASNATLSSEVAQYRSAKVIPYLTNSLTLDFAGSLALLDAYDGYHQPIIQRLLMLSSDKCKISEGNVPNWLSLTNSLHDKDSTQVILVTFDTAQLFEPIKAALKSKHVPFRTYQVTKSLYFGLRTGLTGTPTTLLLTPESRPLLMHTGALAREDVSAFTMALRDHSQLATTLSNPFLKETPSTPISTSTTTSF